MKPFLDNDFLLFSGTAATLYHGYAKDLPIIDYHNHLPPEEIAQDKQFENLTQIWLNGDHYKWRAMRAFGIDEKYITGDATDKEKFLKWAETVPHTLRNPLYHWTHLELQRYFGSDTLLNPETAEAIYDQTQEQLHSSEFSVVGLLKKMKVEVVCTTDDPVDTLEHHKAISKQELGTKVLPTFRPDKAMDFSSTQAFQVYLAKLTQATGADITSFEAFIQAIQTRHGFFHQVGGRLSDHGLSHLEASPYTEDEPEKLFQKLLSGSSLNSLEQSKLRSACLLAFAKMNHAKGWVQQFHLGALRNNNQRMLRELGPDTGFDSIGDFSQAQMMSRFFDQLDNTNQLAKTIVYNLNPADNEVFAAMMGNYNDGSIKGKMQFGSGWWFLDQLDGMEKQINTLSNLGLLSCFVGMLTDSRSFLSFPRHEYFRRLLCNIIGGDVEMGLLPNDEKMLGELVQNICYYNAKSYFNF